MNRIEDNFASGEAELVYGDNDFHIVRGGAYVICAVSGKVIPLGQLRYWSVELQEAYADAGASLQRYLEIRDGT